MSFAASSSESISEPSGCYHAKFLHMLSKLEEIRGACQKTKDLLKDIPKEDIGSGAQGMKKILAISGFKQLRDDYILFNGILNNLFTTSTPSSSDVFMGDMENDFRILQNLQEALSEYKDVLGKMVTTFSPKYMHDEEVCSKVSRFIKHEEIVFPEVPRHNPVSSSIESALARIH
jgi:hypothetical protein